MEGGHITFITNSMGKFYLIRRGINPDGTMSPTEIVEIQDDWHDAGTALDRARRSCDQNPPITSH